MAVFKLNVISQIHGKTNNVNVFICDPFYKEQLRSRKANRKSVLYDILKVEQNRVQSKLQQSNCKYLIVVFIPCTIKTSKLLISYMQPLPYSSQAKNLACFKSIQVSNNNTTEQDLLQETVNYDGVCIRFWSVHFVSWNSWLG